MNHPIQTTSAVLMLVLGSWYFSRNYDVHGLETLRIEPRQGQVEPSEFGVTPWQSPAAPAQEMFTSAVASSTIEPPALSGTLDSQTYVKPLHIASFNLQGFGRQKVDKSTVLDQTARLCRHFEIVSLQGIIGPDRDLLPRLVETINRSGSRYDYLELSSSERTRLAFVFDTKRVQTDRRQLYRVADPRQEMSVDPIVGWFRVQGLPTEQAWTFSLVNVWIDPARAAPEVALLPALIRAVQNDGRHEDDVILAGSFSVETMVLRNLLSGVGYEPVTTGVTSDLYGRTAFDHVLSMRGDHQEFTGRSGAIDFLRLMNMTLGEAEEISDRVPVWAEFSAEEAE